LPSIHFGDVFFLCAALYCLVVDVWQQRALRIAYDGFQEVVATREVLQGYLTTGFLLTASAPLFDHQGWSSTALWGLVALIAVAGLICPGVILFALRGGRLLRSKSYALELTGEAREFVARAGPWVFMMRACIVAALILFVVETVRASGSS
jgi:nitric oxide reductase large subunit